MTTDSTNTDRLAQDMTADQRKEHHAIDKYKISQGIVFQSLYMIVLNRGAQDTRRKKQVGFPPFLLSNTIQIFELEQ